MRQKTFADEAFEHYRKPTRRERFLGEMERIIPWRELCEVIEPYYPKPTGAGRRPVGLDRMLRIHFLQHWFNLSDPAAEEALYDSRAMRRFVGIDLGHEPVPDETTILKFRHLLERHNLGEQLFALMNQHLQHNGARLSRGTIVDATIINAPTSTKNKDRTRDPEMHQTRKGKQYYFGMKAHVGVDGNSKLIHSLATTAANVHDSQMLGDLLHGEETGVWGDSAYTGQGDVIRLHAPRARDLTNKKAHRNRPLTHAQRVSNREKSRVRAKVEHPLLIIKRIFGFRKVRYRGIAKNTSWLHVSCALANLYMVRRRLLHPV